MPSEEPIGFKFGKYDLERTGLFSEMSYISRDKYRGPHSGAFRTLLKGRQMYTGYPKSKCGTQDGYFTDEFMRLFEGDSKRRLLGSVSPGLFIPSTVSKKHACPGDFHGTFGGIVQALDPRPRKKSPYKREPPNFKTNPSKKSGPGYINITLSPYPEYRPDKYDTTIRLYRENFVKHKMKFVSSAPFKSAISSQQYFDGNPYYTEKPAPIYKRVMEKDMSYRGRTFIPSSPGKKDGGSKLGTFSKFPEYKTPRKPGVQREPRETKIFRPQGVPKSTRIRSVVNYNTHLSVNATNWSRYRPAVYPLKST